MPFPYSGMNTRWINGAGLSLLRPPDQPHTAIIHCLMPVSSWDGYRARSIHNHPSDKILTEILEKCWCNLMKIKVVGIVWEAAYSDKHVKDELPYGRLPFSEYLRPGTSPSRNARRKRNTKRDTSTSRKWGGKAPNSPLITGKEDCTWQPCYWFDSFDKYLCIFTGSWQSGRGKCNS